MVSLRMWVATFIRIGRAIRRCVVRALRRITYYGDVRMLADVWFGIRFVN